ncbi:hypothetical protein BU16DRAFT_536094 [Lophium mytilinum]|uniref:Mid2 domain-containing protein n=1 Tax=Lophium mytilinum TaxID=390894 RepID=A0A6A6R7T1_9PEZI|nr:hypothetical protein BU16DRAFT_536094 [Lophium mytilinum]
MYAFLAVAFLSFLTLLVRADNNFTSPPLEGFNVAPNSHVEISWTTDWGSVPIGLAARQAVGSDEWEGQVLFAKWAENQVDPGSYVWTAQTIGGLPITNGFHFTLWLGGGSGPSDGNTFESGAVFIVVDAATPSIAAQSSSSIASTSSTFPLSTSSTTSPSTSETTVSAFKPTTSTFEPSTSSSEPSKSTVQQQPNPTRSSSPSSTSAAAINSNSLGNAANIATIVGTVLGVVFGLLTLLVAWLGFRKDRNGNRVVLSTMRSLRRSRPRRRAVHIV